MIKVFIFANSFFAHTIALSLDSILSIKINEIILLNENHHDREFITNNRIKIECYETLAECILHCDYVLAIKNDTISAQQIKDLKKLAKESNKEFAVIETRKCIKKFNNMKRKVEMQTKNYPTILLLSDGKASQKFCTEILLNSIFSKNNVKFRQIYSKTTFELLNQLKESDLFFDKINDSIFLDEMEGSVLIVAEDIEMKQFRLSEFLRVFNKYNPDFVILQSDVDHKNEKKLSGIVEFGFNSTIDVFIRSSYHIFEKSVLLYCQSMKKCTDNILYIEDYSNYEKKLEEKILMKLSYPKGIKPIS